MARDAISCSGSRCGHDVEVSRVGREVITGAFDLYKHGHARYAILGLPILRGSFESIAGHVVLHTGDDILDRLRNEDFIRITGELAKDRVPHDHGRIGWVEHDDGFAFSGSTDLRNGPGRGAGELVDVGTGSGSGRR